MIISTVNRCCLLYTSGIALRGRMTPQLFGEYRETAESEKKSIAVERLIKQNLGYNTYWDIYHALLADDSEKADAVYNTMLAARTIPDSKMCIRDRLCPESEF